MSPEAQHLPSWSWLSGEPVCSQPGIRIAVPAGAKKAQAWDLVSGPAARVCREAPELFAHVFRALALRVLREILRNQPARFKNYAELTIMKTLEAHKDSHKEVSRVWGARPYVRPDV